DAKSGERIWKANLSKIAKIEPPMWGFSSSPFVYDGKVIVYAGNEKETEGHIFAFDDATGEVAWSSPAGKMSYSSVQTIDVLGTTYLALLSEMGLHLYQPDTGKEALTYDWKHGGYRALQPQVLDGDKILLPTGQGTGTRLVHVSMNEGKP